MSEASRWMLVVQARCLWACIQEPQDSGKDYKTQFFVAFCEPHQKRGICNTYKQTTQPQSFRLDAVQESCRGGCKGEGDADPDQDFLLWEKQRRAWTPWKGPHRRQRRNGRGHSIRTQCLEVVSRFCGFSSSHFPD
ncbi:hypothetical protein P7K49_005513 [Saguinus oedipus]|uniref:Uncharacterized protein n=1 Tax=Saguinus oedipus TaxID=9490 RepID=A0ABQ9VZS5_SAGOE|nr:hypothetical protein P7K49_005513 [Saguinus oedipus]